MLDFCDLCLLFLVITFIKNMDFYKDLECYLI